MFIYMEFGGANYNCLPMSDVNQQDSSSAIRFGDYELNPIRGVLSRKGVALKLQRQPFRVLEILVKRAPNIVSREEIGDSVWGDGVYVDLDQSLNFCIRQIRSVLNDSASNPKFVDTLPKQGYRFIGSIVEVRPSLTEEPSQPPVVENRYRRIGDIKPAPAPPMAFPVQDPAPGRAEPPNGIKTPSRKSRLQFWLVALAALALVIVAVGLGARSWRERLENQAAPKISSLAVLPLDNLSGDPAQNYFADGMTDELTTMLAKSSTLRVISRTSVMQYKGVHRPLPEIARELGVDGVLEGSVERTGDKVHMTIQLIQASSDAHVWAESYDRDANDVVSLPREAAQTIAKKLNSAALERAPQRYVNPEAHDDYLRGRYIWFTGENEEAGKYFRKATELQPDYAPGWAGLSMYYGQGVWDGQLDPKDCAPGEDAARKAVELDDSLPVAHLTLGASIFICRWDWARADQEIARAIELDPNYAEAWHFRSKMYSILGRNEEAIEVQKKAMELAPFERPFAMALTYFTVRQYDAAINEARLRLETRPDDVALHWTLLEAYRRKGAKKEAIQEWEKIMLLSGYKDVAASIRNAYEKGGYNGALLWEVSQLKQKSAKQYVSPVDIAFQYAQLGQKEEALSYLEEGYRQHSPMLLWIQTDPAYDFLHGEERYRAIVKGIGLPPSY
jgi:TolB-like protein/DNA-binding winged helix-turn-helix (wHTH) protein